MAITIGGIKIKKVDISFGDSGELKFTGTYHLSSNTGVVLAKQDFNGYNDIKLNGTQDTIQKILDSIKSLETDLTNTLGLN
jgi:hypothetical protein